MRGRPTLSRDSDLTARGFTVMELLVTLVIVGILTAIALPQYGAYRMRANKARAASELMNVRNAITMLENDTGLGPGGQVPSSCETPGGPEIDLTDCEAGLLCTDGSFDDWDGPYIDTSLIDPWGNEYYIDYDYNCGLGIFGCSADTGWARVLVSFGPSGGVNQYNADEIGVIICDYAG